MKIRHIALPLLAALALSACRGEEDDQTQAAAAKPLPNVEVSKLSEMTWPQNVETTAPLSTTPLMANNMIVLDMSGSMKEEGCSGTHPTRASAASDALKTWMNSRLDENIGLITFSGAGLKMDAGLGQGESHMAGLVQTIDTIEPGSSTPLKSAMTMAQQELEKQAVRQGGTGTYRMIIITDGAASTGEHPAGVVRGIVDNPANMIEIHTVGFCIQGAHSLNDPNRVFYIDAHSPEALAEGLQSTGEKSTFSDTDFKEFSQ